MSDPPRSIDLQVNGYAGADFNRDDLTPEQLHAACEQLEADGVEAVLATVITDRPDRMEARLRRLVELRRADPLAERIIAGIHIEGPFLNADPGYAGAHPPEATVEATVDAAERLLDAAGGLTRLFTLAPERDPDARVTAHLADRGIVVSAGHCDPSLDQLRRATDHGLTMFTHLGNGCPPTLPRHENVVQRALHLSDRLWLSFIADGVHIPPFALGNYLRCCGIERALVVTDAISAASLGPGTYTLGSRRVSIGDDRVARSADGSHFVGSTSTMPRMRAVLRDELGLDETDIDRLTWHNPKRLLGEAAPGD